MSEQARRATPPKRVRRPAGCSFASGCSPPRLATTQLPSATCVTTSHRLDFHPPDKTTSRTHSLSLGDAALFRLGGLERNDPTRSFRLESGDAVIFGGPARLVFHGVDRIIAGGSTLLGLAGRINLTLRRVTRANA